MSNVYTSPYYYSPSQMALERRHQIDSEDRVHIPRQGLLMSFVVVSLLFMAHGTEEYFGGFQADDPVWRWFHQWLFPGISEHAGFLIIHFVLWVALIVVLVLMTKNIIPFTALAILAVVMLLEIYHLVMGLAEGRYVDGEVTSVAMFIAGAWYSFELARAWRRSIAENESPQGGENNAPTEHF